MRHNPYADATPLRLAQMRPGQVRGLRLRLMEIRRNDKRPTEYFLDLTIHCHQPSRKYHLELKADFGASVPRRATLTVVLGRGDAAPPLPLVEQGAPLAPTFDLDYDPFSDWLTLWVATEGAEEIPPQLAGELRLRGLLDERPTGELVTARLPSLKAVMRQTLMGAFRKASSPALALLGGEMRSEDPLEKLDLLRQLFDIGADIRLVEAGVRDIATCEQTLRDFPPLDFGRLDVHDPADAATVVFHPGCPPPLVRECFAAAFEGQFSPASPAAGRRWGELVKAAAVAVCRKDRSLLDENFAAATGLIPDASRQALYRSLIEWAWQQVSPGMRPLRGTAEAYLKVIVGDDPDAAERAAIEVLAHYELIIISVPLG